MTTIIPCPICLAPTVDLDPDVSYSDGRWCDACQYFASGADIDAWYNPVTGWDYGNTGGERCRHPHCEHMVDMQDGGGYPDGVVGGAIFEFEQSIRCWPTATLRKALTELAAARELVETELAERTT